jgi:hypothetical protein
MNKTIKNTLDYLSEHNPHKINPGRKTAHTIPDAIDQGRAMLLGSGGTAGEGGITLMSEAMDDEDEDPPANDDDLLVELV